jgi:simple sugar transport system permease protein
MSQLFTAAFITQLFASTLRMATPVLYASLGETFSQRSGVTNIGIEGIMMIGACTGFVGASLTGSLFLGLLIAMASGIFINALFAVGVILFHGNQIVLGTALNILAAGLSTFIYRSAFGILSVPETIEGFKRISIPLLSKIPILGEVLFDQNILVYAALLLVPLCSFFLYKTRPGLKLRAAGEHPRAADTMGIDAYSERFLGCILDGMFCAVGGMYLSVAYMNSYVDNIVSGRGFIALAAVVFGKWNPKGVLLATLLFGFADALQLRAQAIGLGIPYQFMMMVPYVVTLLAMILLIGKAQGPKANGTNYLRDSQY